MSRLVRTLLFTLVAAWLPVTLHCKLEAAGVFTTPADCCATDPVAAIPDTDCKDDSCPTVEDALYKESTRILKIASPIATGGHVRLALVAFVRDRGATLELSPTRHAPPPELRVGWQFLARAAPPARAPSLKC